MSLNEIPERIGYLILLFLHKQLSPAQRRELDRWILQDPEHEIIFDEAINFENKKAKAWTNKAGIKKASKQVTKSQKMDEYKTMYRKKGIV
jgi:hypothetical protein